MLESVEERDDRWWRAWIDVRLEQAHHHYFQGELETLSALVETVRPQVERHGSPVQQVDFLHVLAQHAYRRERYVLSEETEGLANPRALEQCREMLDPAQQPLPPELRELVEQAVADGERDAVERALKAAAALGYA